MNEYTRDSILKREFPTIDGKRSWGITNEIWKHCVKYGKDLELMARKECEEKAEKARKEAEDAKKSRVDEYDLDDERLSTCNHPQKRPLGLYKIFRKISAF
jgi:hypothetical protein